MDKTTLTQAEVSAAVEAFWRVHKRRPALLHLEKMLGVTTHTVKKFDLERVPMRVRRVWLERARAIHVPTVEEVNRKKAEAGKLGARKRGSDAGLEGRMRKIAEKAEGGGTSFRADWCGSGKGRRVG